MIYLTTGANGAGKTLNTLELVRKKQVEEGRSVYYHGFDLKPEKAAEFGWLQCDPKNWMALPDGAIIILDECQKAFPVRGSGAAIPPHVQQLDEHRKRGFDFFLISQHPLNVDKFILRLIGSPGWHRHLKRAFGTDMVSVLEWSAVNTACEKAGASKSAVVKMVPFPKHVYGWYESAVLHTGKKQIPVKVYLLGVLVVAVPLVFWFGFHQVSALGEKKVSSGSSSGVVASAVPVAPAPDYLGGYSPRIAGFPHTAPRYDEVTKPVSAPYPAACMSMGKRCDCFTQQGTALPTPLAVCKQIVKGGYFVDWAVPPLTGGGGAVPAHSEAAAGGSPAGRTVSEEVRARAVAVRDGETLSAMRGFQRATY